jgi:phosphonate degradation associated HDIG domain protein
MVNPNLISNEIIRLYQQYGSEDYDGEPVSQASHMIQCAMLATSEISDIELVLGAFLHDLGHLLKHEQQIEAMDNYGVVNHEGIGANYLRSQGFSERLCAIVDMHVQAKRYLVATDASYEEKLSEASRETLKWQGGAMSAEKALQFAGHPFFNDIINVRLWDEKAKDANVVLLPLQYFKNLIHEYLKDRY